MAISPRRSVLFMPGSNARALEKAKTLNADVIVFDLEDAVSPDEKGTARVQVCEAITSNGYGERELVVRINGLDTSLAKFDISALANTGAKNILVPKISSVADVKDVLALLKSQGSKAKLWLMIETPAGVLNAAAIAASSPRVEALVFGSNDLSKEMRALPQADRAALQTAMSMTVMAARAAGVDVIDAVYNAFNDVDGFKAECTQGRAFGFDGKSLIHPKQIDAANAVYGPGESELKLAKRQIAAFKKAKADGKGVAVMDERMIEELHVLEAKRLVAFASAIKKRGL